MAHEQTKPGVTSESVPNVFPRREGSDGTEVNAKSVSGNRVSDNYPDVSSPNAFDRSGARVGGQDLRGYVQASSADLPTEDGNMRPDGSERTIREIPAP